MAETPELPPILDELPWALEEREGRVCGVVTTDCRVRDDRGWLVTWRAGEYFGHYADSFEAMMEDEAIREGDLCAAARVARTVERDPVVMAADASVRAEPAFQAGMRFILNPGGRAPFAPAGFEPYQYRADSIARVVAEIEKRRGQVGAIIAALSTVHESAPLFDEPAARLEADKKHREFDLEGALRKWWDRNKRTP